MKVAKHLSSVHEENEEIVFNLRLRHFEDKEMCVCIVAMLSLKLASRKSTIRQRFEKIRYLVGT